MLWRSLEIDELIHELEVHQDHGTEFKITFPEMKFDE